MRDIAAVFQSVDWIMPAYIQVGYLARLAESIESAPDADKQAVLEMHLPELYAEDDLAVMLLERYAKTAHVQEYRTEIAEAIEAAHLGCQHAAVATLLAVLDGVLRNMGNSEGRSAGHGTQHIVKEVAELLACERVSPGSFDERIVMLEVFREFLKNRLLKTTGRYTGAGNLNRHGIHHGVFHQYGHDFNFYRMMSILDVLCFMIGLRKGGISCFAPERTAASQKLATYYRRLWGVGAAAQAAGARL